VKAIVGTAGHIDHGKTALVRALTGIETDRLPEERERGISIELGFAYLELPDGDRAGIVDVPGHERFVKRMLAGAQGFDLVILVVAADDGVMPQTEEHFEICHLLGVRSGVFAITKTDLVDENRVEEVRGELEILAAGTSFEDAPVFPVSARTGDGVDALREYLLRRVPELERERPGGVFRMPVDRAFVIKGHGVVVTGTAAGGGVAVGDELEISPRGTKTRVREVQVHEQPVDRAYAGQRVAINLAGIEKGDVARGDTVVTPGFDSETDRFDAAVEIRPGAGKAIPSHERVRVYLGTADVGGRIVWLDGGESVGPRNTAYAQLFTKQPLVAFSGDRFVLRDETAARTVGGGVVVLSHADAHRRADGPVVPKLRQLAEGGEKDRLAAFLEMIPGLGASIAEAALAVGADRAAVAGAVQGNAKIVPLPSPEDVQLLVSAGRYGRYVESLVEATERYLGDHSNEPGIDLERLRQAAPFPLEPRMFRTLVDSLQAGGKLVRRGSQVCLPGHEVSMNAEDEALADRILAALRDGGTKPPSRKELESGHKISPKRLDSVLSVLVERGTAVKVSTDLVFAREVLEDVEERLKTRLREVSRVTAADFRDLIDASRKYSIPLLDHFDRTGVTVRTGDYRRLKDSVEG
jgi:selenocysteine-specific elongation factor